MHGLVSMDPRIKLILAVAVSWTILFSAIGCAPQAVPLVISNAAIRHEPTPRPAPPATSIEACIARDEFVSRMGVAPSGHLPLRGDPLFAPGDLGPDARAWYDRLWDAISHEEQNAAITARATSDDLYRYGRAVHTHVLALLTAFRVTGDLALLDEVDRIAELMRSRLRDPWRDTRDGSNGTRDGFVNWVFRAGTNKHQGKDIHEFDEMRTHALIAEIAWALHHNRDLISPNGVAYGERADAWRDYLLNHFEAKWRQRNEISGPEFPFLWHVSLHSTVAFIKYHWYLGRMAGSDPHLAEARRLSQVVLDHFVVVSTPNGPALVWPRTLVSEGGNVAYLHPTTYARYVIGDAIDLHLDGAPLWSNPDLPRQLATTIEAFVLAGGNETIGFARDVGGGVERGGIPATDPDDASRIRFHKYAVSLFGVAALWDDSGTIAATNCEVDNWSWGELRSVHLPASQLLAFTARSERP